LSKEPEASPGPRSSGKLVEIADGVHAYLQRGSWGFSNAGLVSSGDASLLVDTLYDLGLTERMLREMRRAVPGAERIRTVVNTHANGDHCWGNQLVTGAEIVSSRAAAEEMLELS
jgi:glyoxylase-like metal-dependent hydrolase (beta-lactamase superfamily II)